ncbi:MAG: MBL fold metallo-hydrolase [Chthoniobacteraceae bacterium]
MLQSGVALGVEGGRWILVNASPDIRAQIEAFPELHPRSERDTPIAGVLLTNADLDHVLGLYMLREGGALDVFATDATRECIERHLGIGAAHRGIRWLAPPLVRMRAIPLPAAAPRYATPFAGEHSVAFEIEGEHGTLVVAPDVGEITPDLDAALHRASAVLFDGTFWSDDELQQIEPKARTAREMGHLPVQASLPRLAALPARVKVFLHINNTNPILAHSAERAAVETAGWQVGRDGFEFDV